MANYYSLITGLPDLLLDDSKPTYSVSEFKELCKELLTETDKRILYYFFLKYDCLNVVKLLKNPEAVIDEKGNLTADECRELIEQSDEMNAEVPCGAPRFLMDFILDYPQRKDTPGFFPEDAVLLAYYRYAMQCEETEVAAWFELNFNITNILTAYIARNYGWKVENYVLDENEVSEAILNSAQAKDFNLSPILDYVDEIIKIAECEDPVMKERQIDAFKWIWLDNQTFFEPFSVVAVFAYLCKLDMNERWEKLDAETGRETFTQIVDNLRSEARVPDEFKK
ncbi:MAG: DUF2764 family protein [Mediterranea massiliensis]|nr:DUF2764 family protein [Mediterranea massiliensis]